jgi:hypothetical protein
MSSKNTTSRTQETKRGNQTVLLINENFICPLLDLVLSSKKKIPEKQPGAPSNLHLLSSQSTLAARNSTQASRFFYPMTAKA